VPFSEVRFFLPVGLCLFFGCPEPKLWVVGDVIVKHLQVFFFHFLFRVRSHGVWGCLGWCCESFFPLSFLCLADLRFIPQCARVCFLKGHATAVFLSLFTLTCPGSRVNLPRFHQGLPHFFSLPPLDVPWQNPPPPPPQQTPPPPHPPPPPPSRTPPVRPPLCCVLRPFFPFSEGFRFFVVWFSHFFEDFPRRTFSRAFEDPSSSVSAFVCPFPFFPHPPSTCLKLACLCFSFFWRSPPLP